MAKIKVSETREARNGIAGTLHVVREGDRVLIDAGGETSVLTGELARWVTAHLIERGTQEGEGTPTRDGLNVAMEDGTTINFKGWPAPPAENVAPTAPAPAGPIEPKVPVSDMPRAPKTIDDWRGIISTGRQVTLPVLENVRASEAPEEYSARVLAPAGLTLADVIASGGLASLVGDATHDGWTIILEAAGIQRSSSNADHTTAKPA